MNNVPVLSTQHLSVGIKNKINLVENIHFDLFEHEFMAVIGPNGCGKSSFIKALIGQLDIIQGHFHFLGKHNLEYTPKSRARYIALMGQNNTVDPRMTVREYIELGRFPHFHHCTRKYDKQCVDSIIEEMSLTKLSSRCVNQLSGGEFQRINLARVLAQEPKLLLLDEPTNHLDPISKIVLLNHIKEKKITTIAVLHELNLVEYFADKVLIIKNGKMSICSDVHTTLNPHWMDKTFGLKTIEFIHPTSERVIRIFDIPERKFSHEM